MVSVGILGCRGRGALLCPRPRKAARGDGGGLLIHSRLRAQAKANEHRPTVQDYKLRPLQDRLRGRSAVGGTAVSHAERICTHGRHVRRRSHALPAVRADTSGRVQTGFGQKRGSADRELPTEPVLDPSCESQQTVRRSACRRTLKRKRSCPSACLARGTGKRAVYAPTHRCRICAALQARKPFPFAKARNSRSC